MTYLFPASKLLNCCAASNIENDPRVGHRAPRTRFSFGIAPRRSNFAGRG
jgi:hypothetical protein